MPRSREGGDDASTSGGGVEDYDDVGIPVVVMQSETDPRLELCWRGDLVAEDNGAGCR